MDNLNLITKQYKGDNLVNSMKTILKDYKKIHSMKAQQDFEGEYCITVFGELWEEGSEGYGQDLYMR